MGSRHLFKTEVQLRPVEESRIQNSHTNAKIYVGLVLIAAGLLLLALTFGTVPPHKHKHTHTHTHTLSENPKLAQ